jgi:hypothetical protein
VAVLSNEITVMRRFLRDPDGQIWTDGELLQYWNDAQLEIQQKTNVLEHVAAYYYPPQYDLVYLFDWELAYADGTVLQYPGNWQLRDMVITYPWEAAYYLDAIQAKDDGYRFTNPWEGVFSGSPADIILVPLHEKIDRMKWTAYDEHPINPISERELSQQDRFYRTHQGYVTHYWRPDDYHNHLVLYPHPSSTADQVTVYTEVLDDTGGIVTSDEDYLQMAETGVITDFIDTEDAFFMVHTVYPRDVAIVTDVAAYPDWLCKYVRHGALERAFGADTDGFIPSLRDYWKVRKDIGIEAIKKFKRSRFKDRDLRMGIPARAGRSRLKLPEGYPVVYP